MKKWAPFLVLLAGCLWGSMGIFVRGLRNVGLNSMEMVAIRAMGAMLFLGVGVFLYDKKLLRIRLKDIWCFLGTGIVSIFFFNFCYFTTIQMISLSVAAILLYTAPAIVALLSAILFHEKLNVQKAAALAMAFTGCIFVTGVLTNSEPLTMKGILFGLGSGFGYAMYSIFGRYALNRGYHTLTITFYTFLFASVATLPFVRIQVLAAAVTEDASTIWLTLALILLNTIAAYLSYTIGLSGMEAGKASILATIEPVVASLIGFFLYKEEMDSGTVIGILLVIGSAVLINMKFGKNIKKAK